MTSPGRPPDTRSSSPLDPFLRPFLERVAAMEGGYSPTSHGPTVADALGWPPAFVEAVYTSARAQGLLEPVRTRGGRGRNRWSVSRHGAAWLTEPAATDEQPADDEHPDAAEHPS